MTVFPVVVGAEAMGDRGVSESVLGPEARASGWSGNSSDLDLRVIFFVIVRPAAIRRGQWPKWHRPGVLVDSRIDVERTVFAIVVSSTWACKRRPCAS